jgi:GNAT superfamily N-acetyltransferase
MFDMPPASHSSVRVNGQLPLDERDWRIGLIVGPSGAGKSTAAHALFGNAVVTGFGWPEERSIRDVDWLQPDWIYQPHGGRFDWRSLQRHPAVDVAVHPIDRAAWSLFAPYHYLSRHLAKGAQCYGAFLDGQCIAFTSYIHFPHPRTKNIKMGHRLVVLPDWQGLGLGGRLDDWLGQHLYEQGYRYHNVVAHPAMIAYYSKSPRWQHEGTRRASGGGQHGAVSLHEHQQTFSNRRIASTFSYVPPREVACAS